MADSDQGLGHIRLLSPLNEEDRQRLAQRCRWRRYANNEQILDQDSDDHDVYFVVDGDVQVVNYSLTGREIAFARVSAGGYFGELSAIDRRPRSASVIAASKCLLASCPPQTFENLLIDYPELGISVIRKLAGIIRSCDERIMDLSTMSAVQRVYSELLRMASPDPHRENVWRIKPIPTHKAIASQISTTRETVARTMSQLSAAEILERKGSTIWILNRERLEDLAGSLDSEYDAR